VHRRSVCGARPTDDDLLAAPVRRNRSSDLAALEEVALKLGSDLLEAISHRPTVLWQAPDCL
jgi:hypothetical protein